MGFARSLAAAGPHRVLWGNADGAAGEGKRWAGRGYMMPGMSPASRDPFLLPPRKMEVGWKERNITLKV